MSIRQHSIVTYVATTCCLLLLSACHTLNEASPPKHIKTGNTAAGTFIGFSAGLAAVSTIPLPLGVALGSAFGLATGQHYGSVKGIADRLESEGAQVVQIGDITTVYLPSDKLFQLNTAKITRKAYPMLTNLSQMAKALSGQHIQVVGYSDDVGSAAQSKSLSTRQAQSVSGYLWANGVPESLVTTKGLGHAAPIANNRIQLWQCTEPSRRSGVPETTYSIKKPHLLNARLTRAS